MIFAINMCCYKAIPTPSVSGSVNVNIKLVPIGMIVMEVRSIFKRHKAFQW